MKVFKKGDIVRVVNDGADYENIDWLKKEFPDYKIGDTFEVFNFRNSGFPASNTIQLKSDESGLGHPAERFELVGNKPSLTQFLPEVQSAIVSQNIADVKDEQRRLIRRRFDSSMTPAFARTWIEAAQLLGFDDLAAEMSNDLD